MAKGKGLLAKSCFHRGLVLHVAQNDWSNVADLGPIHLAPCTYLDASFREGR